MTFDVRPVVLRGASVVLEPISDADTAGLFDIGQHVSDWAFMPIPGFVTLSDAREWVREAVELASSGTHVTFVLKDPSNARVMGSSRYMTIRPPHRGLEIGYTWLGNEFQRTRVNTEAKYLLLSHAFDALGAYRVELKTDSRNVRSQRAIERIGATKEGVLRCHMVTQQGYIRDSVMYAITFRDWPAVKAALELKLA